jgi:transposase-like protein
MAKKKNGKKKNFTEAQRQAAVEMLAEGSSLAQTAKAFDCSIASLQSWKKQYCGKAKNGAKRPIAEHPVPATPVEKPKAQVPYDKFVRKFLEKRAVDILLMDSAKRDEIMSFVNDALQYSYDALQ